MAGQLTAPRIIWAALLASTLIYVVVLELTATSGEPHWEMLLVPLAIAGASTAGASLVAPGIVLRRHLATRDDPAATSTDSAGVYLVTLIIALALAESVAIFGLVLGLQGAPPKVVMPFFTVAWVLMLARFPTQEKLDAFVSGR